MDGYWDSHVGQYPSILHLIQDYAGAEPSFFLGFLLDPSTQPPAISLAPELGRDVIDQLCYLTCTCLFTLHRERLKKLGFWK